jgi:hypothetical protein
MGRVERAGKRRWHLEGEAGHAARGQFRSKHGGRRPADLLMNSVKSWQPDRGVGKMTMRRDCFVSPFRRQIAVVLTAASAED